MKHMKRFKQGYLDICFYWTGMYQRRDNKILRSLNFGGYITKC